MNTSLDNLVTESLQRGADSAPAPMPNVDKIVGKANGRRRRRLAGLALVPAAAVAAVAIVVPQIGDGGEVAPGPAGSTGTGADVPIFFTSGRAAQALLPDGTQVNLTASGEDIYAGGGGLAYVIDDESRPRPIRVDPLTGAVTKPETAVPGPVVGFKTSPDGSMLATQDRSGEVRIQSVSEQDPSGADGILATFEFNDPEETELVALTDETVLVRRGERLSISVGKPWADKTPVAERRWVDVPVDPGSMLYSAEIDGSMIVVPRQSGTVDRFTIDVAAGTVRKLDEFSVPNLDPGTGRMSQLGERYAYLEMVEGETKTAIQVRGPQGVDSMRPPINDRPSTLAWLNEDDLLVSTTKQLWLCPVATKQCSVLPARGSDFLLPR